MMPGRQWQDGLHQAIQAKEKLEITLETITAARVTVQDFFKRYNKLAGMTGTASSDAAELRRIYKVGVFKVPTNRPCRRVWLPDRVFSTMDERFQAVADQIVEWNKKGVPVLVGTRSIEKSERLSALLEAQGIEHQILNAKNHEIEAQIVAQAGQRGRVTVATNMAGRGTDIKLGDGVAELGGLHVIGTERHEARRIDRQLSGRCARQGDPGLAQFFVSLDDEIIEAFGEKPAARIRKRLHGTGRADQRRACGGSSSPPSARRNASTSATASCSCTTRSSVPRCARTWGSTPCSADLSPTRGGISATSSFTSRSTWSSGPSVWAATLARSAPLAQSRQLGQVLAKASLSRTWRAAGNGPAASSRHRRAAPSSARTPSRLRAGRPGRSSPPLA